MWFSLGGSDVKRQQSYGKFGLGHMGAALRSTSRLNHKQGVGFPGLWV